MTLLALWYRKEKDDIYAIADSRLSDKNGTVIDSAPKFTIANVICYTPGKKNEYSNIALNRQIIIGYTGSSTIACSSILTAQAYLSNLALRKGGASPRMSDIAEMIRKIIEYNISQAWLLWQEKSICEIIMFGFLPSDREFKACVIKANPNKSKLSVVFLENIKDELYAFGSYANHFLDNIQDKMRNTGNFSPFELLEKAISDDKHCSIGGHIQVAIATKSNAMLPHVIHPRLDRGEFEADVTFLGRDVSEIGPVGDCLVGLTAVGPDFLTLMSDRKKAGYVDR